MTPLKDIINTPDFYQSIWSVLRTRFNATCTRLPDAGFVAGQAVASAIYELLGIGEGPYRDLDWFVDRKDASYSAVEPNQARQYRSAFEPSERLYTYVERFRGHSGVLTPFSSWSSSFSDGLKTGFLDKSHYRIHASFTLRDAPFVNVVEVSAGGYDARLSIEDVLNGFDINACQVGLDLVSKRVVFTPAFEAFMADHVLRVTSLSTPAHTAFRLLKKNQDLPFTSVDLPREMQLLQQARLIGMYCEEKCGLGWLRGHLFQQQTWDKYSAFHEAVAPYFVKADRTVEIDKKYHHMFTLDPHNIAPDAQAEVAGIIAKEELIDYDSVGLSYLMLAQQLMLPMPVLSGPAKDWWDQLGGQEVLDDDDLNNAECAKQLLSRFIIADPAGASAVPAQERESVLQGMEAYRRIVNVWATTTAGVQRDGLFTQLRTVLKNLNEVAVKDPFLMNAFAMHSSYWLANQSGTSYEKMVSLPSPAIPDYLAALQWATHVWQQKTAMVFDALVAAWVKRGVFDVFGADVQVCTVSSFKDMRQLPTKEQNAAVALFSRIERSEIILCYVKPAGAEPVVLTWTFARNERNDFVFSIERPLYIGGACQPMPQITMTAADFDAMGGVGQAMHHYLWQKTAEFLGVGDVAGVEDIPF